MKRLCDHVIQDRMGHPDLEWAWLDDRALDPAEQAKLLDLYVRSGIYTVNEARAALGLDPVPGGDAARIYGTSGAMPLAKPAPAATKQAAATVPFFKTYNPNEPRIPAGNSGGGQWTDGSGDGSFEVAARGDIPCQGGYCESGGSRGTAAMYRIFGRNVCRDCAVKMMGLDGLPGAVQTKELERYLIRQ